MAPLPAPRLLPLAGTTSLSPSSPPPPPPLPPGPPFTRPGIRAERINRPRLFGGHPHSPGSPFLRAPTGGERGRRRRAGRPHGLRGTGRAGQVDIGAGRFGAQGGVPASARKEATAAEVGWGRGPPKRFR
ncbi:unnamed protein product [Rangifer tarandus platyrhynchus]|uniref:Uncharacterized protein n=1 Tax=Rangifer tarandus platyrhynchus TaxID=3082113 RepID=A0AC59ZVY3_RANTA